MTTLRLTAGQSAIVGYGSLISRASIAKTLGREYDGFFSACRVAGWRRSWDAAMPNRSFYFADAGDRVYPDRILYLNVRPVAGAVMNAVVFPVNAEELSAMHGREWIYEPRIVTAELRDVAVEGGDAVMYVARPDYVATGVRHPRDAAVRASYLQIVGDGLERMGPAFRAEYESTTDPVPPVVIEDVLDPDRQRSWSAAALDRRG